MVRLSIAVPLSLHDVDVLAWARIDHVQIALRQSEVLDLGHRGRLERPRHSSRFQHLVRMVLGVQLPPRLVDVENQLAVLDPLPRLCVGGRMVHDRLRRQSFAFAFRRGRVWTTRAPQKDQRETERTDDRSRPLDHSMPPVAADPTNRAPESLLDIFMTEHWLL